MDDSGRMHLPGFVGQTVEETGVKKPAFGKIAASLINDEVDEAARMAVEGAALSAARELGSRKTRRASLSNRERIG